MKNFILSTLLIFAIQNTFASAANEYIKSKDDIVFHTPDMFKFSDVGKISEFRGVIDRVYFKSHDLKMVDLYQFKTDAVKVDKELCMYFVEKIFALSKSKIFELKTFKIEDSNKGKICEVYIADKVKQKKEVDSYYRFASIGFVNAKANVLVYHPKAGINDEKITEVRKFWSSLR